MAKGVSEIISAGTYCRLVFGAFSHWAGYLLSFLGNHRLRLRNSHADSRDHKRDEHRLESLPPDTSSTLLSPDIQVHVLPERGSVQHKSGVAITASPTKRQLPRWRRSAAAEQLTTWHMPTGTLKPGYKASPTFPYPPSGKARIFIEADNPVDIFVSTPQVAEQITSVQSAAQLAPNVLIYSRQLGMDQIITLPEAWKSTGWSITIGHSGSTQEPIAVHYAVYPV